MKISQATLDAIDENADLLDEGLFKFISAVKHAPFPRYEPVIPTLMLVLTDIYDGDWGEIYRKLKEEGYFTWNYLDQVNKDSTGGIINNDFANFIDQIDYCVAESDDKSVFGNLDKVNPNDIFDFTSKLGCIPHLMIPCIHNSIEISILKTYNGDAYTAVLVNREKFPQAIPITKTDLRHIYFFRLSKTILSSADWYDNRDNGLVWVPLNQIVKFKIGRKSDHRVHITALPKAIIEKHGLPIVESITLNDIEFRVS